KTGADTSVKLDPAQLPAQGHLEIRNLVVNDLAPGENERSNNSVQFQLTVGNGAFTTASQVRYDRAHRIQQHGDIHYATRGNTSTPRKLIVAFPDFAKPTSPVQYPIDIADDIGATELHEAIIVSFQDRYSHNGTFLFWDSSGRSMLHAV